MKIDSIRPKGIMRLANIAYEEDLSFYLENVDRFTERFCPGCSNATSDVYLRHREFNFSRCQACWTVFMNPGPTQALVGEFYEQSHVYKYWSEHVYPETQESRRDKLAVPRAEVIAQALLGHSGELTVAEIGAGTGDVLFEIKRKYPHAGVIAVEPNPDMWASYLNQNIKLYKSGYEVALQELHDLDLVCAFEVLEHLLEPLEFFQKCSRALKKGGKLVCSTPNAASIELQALMGKSNTVDIEHISILTPAALHRLASETGFSIDFIKTPGEFDLELLSKESAFLKALRALSHLSLLKLQEKISRYGLSSHMKFVMTKI